MQEKGKAHKGLLLSGFASLFVVSFLDNSRGPILPVLCAQLNIPYETAGQFLSTGCLAAVLVTLLMGQILKRRGERFVATGIAFFAVLPGCLAPFVDSSTLLLLLGALMGASVALLGSICNILTIKGSPEHLRGRYLSFQQVMYGVGSLLAPFVFGLLVQHNQPWWWMLVLASGSIFLLGINFLLVLPKERPAPPPSPDQAPKKSLGGKGVMMLMLFAFYVAGEVLASMWMSSLLVGRQGKSPAEAAQYGIVFFAIIGLSRFCCFLFAKPQWETRILFLSLGSGIVFGTLGQQGISWALPLVALLGPFFPLCMAKVSRQFPDNWQTLTIYIYVSIQAMLGIMHQSVGTVADALGIENAFLISPLFLLVAMALLIPTLRPVKAVQ